MRITFILSSLWLSGGVRVVVEFANRMARRGHAVTLVAPKGTLDPDVIREVDANVAIRESRLSRSASGRLPSHIRLAWSLARAVPHSDVIVSTHTPTTVSGLVAGRLLRRGALVWLYQDYREMFRGRRVEDWMMRHALAWHTRALVVADSPRRELNEYASGDIVAVGQGLPDAGVFRPTEPEESAEKFPSRTLLFLGDMRPRKGLADFLEAASLVHERIPDTRLLIVSKDDCTIASAVPFDFVRRPSRHALARYYADSDVFVSASWWESFGMPPLEAMACGACVVMTDSRGVREFARSGENCLITPPNDPRALAEAILRVLDDQELAKRLRANGPATAARFSWDGAADRFETALTDVVPTRPRARRMLGAPRKGLRL